VAEAIRFGDPVIEVRLRRSSRARRMVLRVVQAGRGPTLTLPPGVPIAKATAFLNDHEGWLRRHIAAGAARRRLGDGCAVPFLGEPLTVRAGGARLVRAGSELIVPGADGTLGPRVAAWLREEARGACLDGVERHAAKIGRRVGRITLRDPRTRWGSCTSSGDLMFSWRLVMAPPAVLDYVVAHEVAHLVEMNHAPRFWAVVRQICPEFEMSRDWLRRHGAELHAFSFAGGA
jgi:predicted metal-dependent hydrolase